MTDPSSTAKCVFLEAVENHSPREWAAFLDAKCGTDTILRRRVEVLLEAHGQANRLLDAAGPVATIDLWRASELSGTSIGPYRLLEVIGEGGFGVVYLAEQIDPVRRQVALKIIKPGMNSRQVLARFEAERQALAMMDHPHIAKVFGGGTTESGRPYFVMELVKGVPITEYCDKCQLGMRARLELFVLVCRAVEHAHDMGIIHRDLKPSNVLIAAQDGRPAPKVIDFGVAKAIGQKLTEHTMRTQFAQLIGTPMYMSPEQAELRRIDIDTRSDVYSLGVLLYELLTGATPFASDQLSEVPIEELRRIICEVEPPRPSTRVSTLSAHGQTTVTGSRYRDSEQLLQQLRGELDWIAMKAMAKDRVQRYASANDLAADIDRYLRHEPVQARPVSVLYRVRKSVRRNRALVGSLVTIFLALSSGLAVATVAFLQAIDQRDRAVLAEATAKQRLAEVTEEQENNEILIQLLGGRVGFPWGKHYYGDQRTLRESLESFASQVEERLQGRPKMEINYRKIFAQAYRDLGEPDKARLHCLKALELAETVLGPEHETVADILTELADEVSRQRGRNSLAEDLTVEPFDQRSSQAFAERALSIYELLGVDTLGSGHAIFCLAWYVEPDVERHSEAEGYLRQALQIARDLAPEADSFRQVYAMWDLVEHLTWQKQGGHVEARLLIDNAVAMSQRVNGDAHFLTAGVIAERGEWLRFQGLADEALASFRQAYEILRRSDPTYETRSILIAMSMAEIYCISHRYHEAMKVLNEIERLSREHRDMESLVPCRYLRGWANVLRHDYASAENCLRQAVELAEEHLVENHRYTVLSKFYLARCLDALGRTDEAQRQWQQLLPLTRGRVDLPHARQMELYAHAWALLHCGDTDERSIREALDTAERGLERAAVWPAYGSEPHLLLAKAVAQYRLDKSAGRSFDSVTAMLRDELKHYRYIPLRSLHRHVPTTRDELENTLAQYLVEQGRLDAAAEVYREGIAARADQITEGSEREFQIALAQLRLGEFLLDHAPHFPWNLAEHELLMAQAILASDSEAADANRRQAATLLIELYRQSNRPAEVAKWKAELDALNQHILPKDDGAEIRDRTPVSSRLVPLDT